MDRWFVAIQGKKFGPLSKEKLQILAKQNMLSPQDHLWMMGMSDWVPAAQLAEIFNPPAPPSAVDLALPPVQNNDEREWYYNNAGEKVGPVTFAKLKQLAETGVVTRSSFVWRHGASNGWLPAWQCPDVHPYLQDKPGPRTLSILKALAKLKPLSH